MLLIGLRGPNDTNFGDINMRRVIENAIHNTTNEVTYSRRKPFARAVDLVIDASGYAYFSSMGQGNFISALECQATTGNSPWYFIPQAWGPFKPIDKSRTVSITSGNYVWARDTTSYRYLRDLGIPNVVAPDITFADDTDFCDNKEDYVAICPNTRISNVNYVTWLHSLCRLFPNYKIIVGEKNDIGFAKQFGAVTSDVDDVKEVLRHASLVISSRYHILLYALMYATPVMCVGWSHKYDELFTDIGINKWIISVETTQKDIDNLYCRSGEQIDKIKASVGIYKKQATNLLNSVVSIKLC